MKKIVQLIGVMFFICPTVSASVVPEGYSTFIESSAAQIVTKHNGQAIYIENSNPQNKIFIDTTTEEVIFWFSDASYIKINPVNQMITQLGRHRPRLGNAQMDTYHISVIGRQPVWDLTIENRRLWERFTEFAQAVSVPLLSSHAQSSVSTLFKQNSSPVETVLEATNFVTQATDRCEAERDNALHGYLGHQTLSSCHSSEDNQLIIAALGDLIGCISPAAAVGACGLAIAHHVWAIGEKEEQVYQCRRAKDVADRDLRICEEAASNSGGGGGGWIDPGADGGNNGGIPAPTIRCAEWIQLKNTTSGDITYCSRWTSIP